MNASEWGSTVYLSTGFDMSGYTDLQVEFRRPDGTTFTREAVLGTMTFTDPLSKITFTANQYASYVLVADDIDVAGPWSARVIYSDGTQYLPSSYSTFTVGP